MNQLGMHVSNEEAKKIVDFYDIYKKGEFNYKVTLASARYCARAVGTGRSRFGRY